MYVLTRCGVCHRPRIADMSRKESSCPYCGCVQDTSDLPRYFQSESQSEVREAMAQGVGFFPPDDSFKKGRIAEADPLSTLAYRYEHCPDLEERMTILAEGLTSIKGEFTLDDMREIAGDRAEKMLSAMLDRCIVSEIRTGRYKARSHLRGTSPLFLPSIFRTSRMTCGSLT